MKFIADENIFPKIVEFLRNKNYDVKDIREHNLCGSSDNDLFALAINEKRILLTFDKHFCNILNYPPSKACGIICIRIHPPLLEDICNALTKFFNQCPLETYKGKLIIISKIGFRIR